MRRINAITCLFLLSITISFTWIVSSCSTDDDNNEIIGGVSVNKGKKLIYLSVGNKGYEINYDSFGRLISVELMELLSGIKGNIIIIDYDKKEIVQYGRSFSFQMNDKGFISKIMYDSPSIFYRCDYKYIYDSDNHLVEVQKFYKDTDSLLAKNVYNYIGDNLVRWLRYDPSRNTGSAQIYTYRYGNDDNVGNSIHLLNDKYYGGWSLGFDEPSDGGYLDIIYFQSGLFGKVSKKLMTNKSGKWHEISIEYTFDEDYYITTAIETNTKKKDESPKTYYFVYE